MRAIKSKLPVWGVAFQVSPSGNLEEAAGLKWFRETGAMLRAGDGWLINAGRGAEQLARPGDWIVLGLAGALERYGPAEFSVLFDTATGPEADSWLAQAA